MRSVVTGEGAAELPAHLVTQPLGAEDFRVFVDHKEFLPEVVGGTDGVAEIDIGGVFCTLGDGTTGSDFLRGVQGEGFEVVVGDAVGAEGDFCEGEGFVVVDAVVVCKVVFEGEIGGDVVGDVGEGALLDAVDAVGADVALGAEGDEVPALHEEFDAVGAEVVLVVAFFGELVVSDEELAAAVDALEYLGEVALTGGNVFKGYLVEVFAVGGEPLSSYDGAHDPFAGTGLEDPLVVGGEIVVVVVGVAFDMDVEHALDAHLAAAEFLFVEGFAAEALVPFLLDCVVCSVVSVYEEVDEPDAFLECAVVGHGVWFWLGTNITKGLPHIAW